MAPRPMPQIAVPSRPAAPKITAPSRPSPPPAASASPPRQDLIGQREQRTPQPQQPQQPPQPPQPQQTQQTVQERQRDNLSPQNAQRQQRIDRLQQRVQELKSQQPEGQRAQRVQQRLLQTEQRQLQREQRLQQLQQTAQERQRDTLSRQTGQRQERIDRLQQRVQELQSQQPDGLRAQRAQRLLLQAQDRLLQREQRLQQRDLARRQELGMPPSSGQPGTAAAAVQGAARGRFAERFRHNSDPQVQAALEGRRHGWAPRHAWRRGLRAAFVPWAGHVFWPYAYLDVFEYTFWPRAYEPGYWAYAYDDFVDNVFWGADSPSAAYARLGSTEDRESDGVTGDSRPRQSTGVSQQAVRQLCDEPEKGVTAWPIASIEQAVQPTSEQRALLDELKSAAAKAANAFKESCGESYAMTPPGRLRSMMNRISATLEAVRIVRPALEKFYNSLSDEQQARFNALGPNIGEQSQPQPQQEANAQPDTCGEPKPGLTNLPIERIETVIRPAGTQKDALDRLREATEKGVQGLQAACPEDVPLTPVGRLAAMENRLEAMMQAAKLVQPALDEFYAALGSEQKARFNTLGRFAGQ
jgi:LTXXQ motif family protein